MLEMTEHSLWRFSRVFHRSLKEQEFQELESLIDDDVEWAAPGPVGIFPFLGNRSGKGAVIEACRQMAASFRVRRFERESLMLGPDSASSMLRYFLSLGETERPVTLRLAHFIQFKDGRLSRLNVVVDTFDLAEQVHGRTARLPMVGLAAVW